MPWCCLLVDKLTSLFQNFYLKAAMIIIQQRIPVAPLYASRTGSKKVNVWFNLDLDDTDAFREELSLWKNVDVYRHRPPPLVIETYIDAKELTANQTLVLLDEQGKRWNVDTAMSNKMDVVSGSRKAGRVNEAKPDVVLERWAVELRPRNGDIALPQLPVAYKHAVVIFRSLYTYAGLMPTQKLLKRLTKVTVHQNTLKVCCRVKVGEFSSPRWDGLNLPLIDSESQVVEDYTFGMVDTPVGELHINVSYRKHCDFRVDDSEELLSSHFINLDERYFQPSLNSHQRTASQPQSLGRRDTGSLQSTLLNASLRQEAQHYGGHTPLYSQGAGMISSPSSAYRGPQFGGPSLSSSPADHTYMNLRSVHGSKSSLRGTGDGGVTRRPSVSFMQPFKSPSLSNSPSADAIPPSPRTSVTRISSTTAPIAARNRSAISPVIPKSTPSYDAPGPLGISPSPRPPSIGRYSSSFGARKPRPSTGQMRADDEMSSGKGSYSSSIQRPGSAAINEQGSRPNEDDRVVDFLKLLDTKQPLKMFSHGDSSKKATTALVKFQQMKDSHNALSDSISQSLLLQKTGSQSAPGRQSSSMMQPLPASSYSPSSSPGNPMSSYTSFTPTVPSRLSAGQTAVYSSRHQARELDGFGPNHHSSTAAGRSDDQLAATSPLDIPASSPRPFHGPPGPSSYHESREFDRPVYGPTSASGDIGVLSLSKLGDELRLASEEDLPGRSATRDNGDAHREAREDERGVPSGGFAGGLTGSSSSSLRGRLYRGSGRGTTYTPPGGSQTYLSKDQGDSVGSDKPMGRRTPSYREEEDLLFAMSDMSSARRSMEPDDSASHGNSQRFSRAPSGGGSSGSGPTGRVNRW
ncbi:autophagy-related protein 13-domain-containing protein [Terfezia claveryi]|nr:autophagy-related protein 13-domain-containing protein [Terfezia claveryi]